MKLIATISPTDIAAWTSLALVMITAVGTIASAIVATAAKVYGQANAARLEAQHDVQQNQQTQISAIQLATPTAQPASSLKLTVNHELLGQSIVNAMTAATKNQPHWPAASPVIPPKV